MFELIHTHEVLLNQLVSHHPAQQVALILPKPFKLRLFHQRHRRRKIKRSHVAPASKYL